MSNSDNWEFYTDKGGEHRWRRTSSNGNIVGAATEGYKAKSDAVKNAQRHGYEGNPDGLGANDKWEFYEDNGGKHRWKRTASNGNKVGASSQGYASAADAKANAKRNGFSG